MKTKMLDEQRRDIFDLAAERWRETFRKAALEEQGTYVHADAVREIAESLRNIVVEFGHPSGGYLFDQIDRLDALVKVADGN